MMITELDPGADPRLAAVFAAAAAPAELPLAGEPEALTAYRRSHGRSRMASILGPRPVHLVVAGLFSGVLLAGGVATAATGSMPIVGHHHATRAVPTAPADHRQSDAVTDAVTNNGTDHGGTDNRATDHGGADGEADDIGDSGPGTAGHPAPKPILGSVAKGVATCTAAPHGRCGAGQQGKALAAHTHRHGNADASARENRPGGSHHGRGHRPGPALRGPHGTKDHSG
jgi:hypothetical protein